MAKKALIISTVSKQFFLFEQANFEVLASLGYEIHCAADFSEKNPRLDKLNIIKHHFDIKRSPFSLLNFKAYRQLLSIMKSNQFELVHCHTPMGAVLGRIAARKIGIKKIIYTAHGFHFYRGAPLINWLLYFPVEKYLSSINDILITINEEDYIRAKKSLRSKKIEYIPGVGVDLDLYSQETAQNISDTLNFQILSGDILLLSVGELNKNKNHKVVIRALKKLNNKRLHYIICGVGSEKRSLEKLTRKLGLVSNVHFLGYRNDIVDLYRLSDLFILPSYREGLSLSLMEAMASGLPAIVSDIRGNRELIVNGYGGFLNSPNDFNGIAKNILNIIENDEIRTKMSKYNIDRIQMYSKSIVKRKMCELYEDK